MKNFHAQAVVRCPNSVTQETLQSVNDTSNPKKGIVANTRLYKSQGTPSGKPRKQPPAKTSCKNPQCFEGGGGGGTAPASEDRVSTEQEPPATSDVLWRLNEGAAFVGLQFLGNWQSNKDPKTKRKLVPGVFKQAVVSDQLE